MRKGQILFAVLMVIVIGLIFVGCGDKAASAILYKYEGTGTTRDTPPMKYIKVEVIPTDESAHEFQASDFSIIRNGVKEQGSSFITGTSYSNNNGIETWESTTAPTFRIEINNGARLQIIFASVEGITGVYYKTQKL